MFVMLTQKITLIVNGVGGMSIKVKTRRYALKVRVKTPEGRERAHEMICYGLDEIAKMHKSVDPKQLKQFFPEVPRIFSDPSPLSPLESLKIPRGPSGSLGVPRGP